MAKTGKKSKKKSDHLGNAPTEVDTNNNLDAKSPIEPIKEKEDLKDLNFKVPKSFKKEFKSYASDQETSMVELLKRGFELVKKFDN